MTRVALWIVLALIAVGIAAAGWLIVRSFDPEPGAEMSLMGLPMVAMPVATLAVVAIGIVSACGERLKAWERGVAWAAGVLTLAVFGAMFVLG